MEDAVLHQLETSEIAKELFYQATNFLVKTTNFKVLRFSEPMDKLVLSKISCGTKLAATSTSRKRK